MRVERFKKWGTYKRIFVYRTKNNDPCFSSSYLQFTTPSSPHTITFLKRGLALRVAFILISGDSYAY
ncbi:hypothetical protein KM043_010044 [Ampulex compressa]|nr:hypothetical protein KM043_010044 [Ampulex compressa]